MKKTELTSHRAKLAQPIEPGNLVWEGLIAALIGVDQHVANSC